VALENCYVEVTEVTGRVGINDNGDDDTVASAITSACRAIDDYCGQFFYKLTDATPRKFRPSSALFAWVDPFHTTTGLEIKTDTAGDGGFATTWATTDYELERFGGSMANMWNAPYDTIHAGYSWVLPMCGRRRETLQVTAQWGWDKVPPIVKEAAKILTVDLWKRKDVAFGVQTGTIEFGGLRVGRDVMAQVESLLASFRRVDRVVGV